MTRTLFLVFGLLAAGCSSDAPSASGLRDSFAAQLAANPSVAGLTRQGDDLTFTGPGVDGPDRARWRVHIDSAVVERTGDPKSPYKGTVKSSWFANDQPILPSERESNLPRSLMSNGLAQDCWANWDPDTRTWGWE
jgi:hypothetical protein